MVVLDSLLELHSPALKALYMDNKWSGIRKNLYIAPPDMGGAFFPLLRRLDLISSLIRDWEKGCGCTGIAFEGWSLKANNCRKMPGTG